MIKGLLVSINFIGVLFYSLFFAADINVVQTLPDTLQPGEEVVVEVTVTKGAVSDFAQLKLEIPDGITVSQKDNKGSSFTFKEGVARWVWYSLPSEESFTFKYKLSADEGTSGTRAITGKFSYVVDNNPQSFVFQKHTINIGEGTSVSTDPVDGGTLVVDDPPVVPKSGQQATFTRILVDQGDGTYLVRLLIKKNDITGFGRAKDLIPEGFTASKGDVKGAIFSFVDQNAKFIWTELPAAAEFEVTYTLTADPGMSGEHPITGEFSYLEDDEETGEETREASAGTTMISIDGASTADNGDNGTTGNNGDDGNTGDNGDNGTTGDNGNTADNGDNGTTGDDGNTGDNGDNGTTGDNGNTADNGDDGTTGDDGNTGDNGDDGTTGDDGNTGDNGDNGTTGDDGNTGDNGDNGTTGDDGNTGDNGDNGTTGDDGNTGDNGDNGTTGDSGDITPAIVVTCERTVTKQSDDKFKVEVIINKSTASGFARLKEDIPAGFTAIEGESASGRFSFKDNAVKYVWTMLPSAEQLTITYILQADGDISGSFDLNGTLSYVENNDTKKVLFGPTSFDVAPPALADNGAGDNGDNGTGDNGDNGTGDNGDNGTGDNGDNGTGDNGDNGTGDNGDNGTAGVVSTPSPENGIAYRVQVLAAHKVVEGDYFAKKFNYSGNVNLENHEGWTKYTVGSFTEYKGARDERQTITNGGHDFPGPFVAAYNDGARITVQEALMVSNQQWQK